jgi:TonB family protein
MTSRVCILSLCALFVILGLAGLAEAKRPIQTKDTIPVPPPSELLKLASSQFTVPRQTVAYPDELSHYLTGCPPVEVWFKVQRAEAGRRVASVVYSSRPSDEIENEAAKIMGATVVQMPADSAKPEAFWYHRVVLVAPGQLLKLDPNAIPVPRDLPRTEIAPDSGYVAAQLIEKGKFDIKRIVIHPRFSGKVIMRCHVAASGKVTHVSVVSSSGMTDFDYTAVDAAYRNSYKPATMKGEPVESDVLDEFGYSVRQ